MLLEERKNELKNIALKEYSNGYLMFYLIDNGDLDHIIQHITDKKTITNSTAIVKKGYLTGNEQFIDILGEVLYWFESSFPPLKRKEQHIRSIFENQIPKFMLCKKYWGDNSFIPYYKKNIKILFVRNFYENIKFIYDQYEDFFYKYNINNNFSLNNNNHLDTIYNFLIEMIWCNYDTGLLSLNYLFSNYHTSIKNFKNRYKKDKGKTNYYVLQDYINHWEHLIHNYNKNIDIIQKLLKEKFSK